MQVHEPVALLQAIEADTGPCADAILGIPCVFDLESVERINVSQSKMGNKWRFGRWEGAQEQRKRYFRKVEKRRGNWRKVLKLRRPPVVSGRQPGSRNRSSVMLGDPHQLGDHINATRPVAFELGSPPKTFCIGHREAEPGSRDSWRCVVCKWKPLG
jgi:hypothetical protein